jgi:hypothetical protein
MAGTPQTRSLAVQVPSVVSDFVGIKEAGRP